MGNIQKKAPYSKKRRTVRLHRKHGGDRVAMRLFCFAYAGGGASIFSSWSKYLPNFVEICAVELPGREALFREPPFTRLPPLIEAILRSISEVLDLPFALFGHSMGALLAFELARGLRHRHLTEPATLFISGHRAPHLPDPHPPVADLPDLELIAELQRLQGTPPEALENKELMLLLLPLLRADFAICENYHYQAESPLECPIVAFGGVDDTEIEQAEILAWREHTNNVFRVQMMLGNHFFIHSAKKSMLNVLSKELTSLK
jgi:medium-chain acyl-[acyl-carrier-protein] hydrolase